MSNPSAQRRADAIAHRQDQLLRKDLSLRDLVFAQILFIVGLQWVGVAAKEGPSHVVLWLMAVLLFYIPSAVVAVWLNRQMPLEGGLYQWAKLGFNETVGFIVAWNLWVFTILNMTNIGLQFTQYFGYMFGPGVTEFMERNWVICAMSAIVIGALALLTIIGLKLGRWVHTAGGILMVVIFAMIIALPWVNVASGTLSGFNPVATAWPTLGSILTLNILGKMGFGAFAGFEYVAIHAGECRDPEKSITRATITAAPIVTLLFILGTASVVGMIPEAEIDLIAPIPQLLTRGFGPLGAVAAIAPLTLSAMLAIRFAQASVNFAGSTRLPMVAGWDNLLPAWFTKLSKRYKTPVNSIVFVAAITFTLATLGLVGVGKQEAFQLLWNSAGIFYGLTYLVMFAVPVFGLKGTRFVVPAFVKICALSGFLMTALYVGLSVLPIIDVGSKLAFALKITGLIVLANVVGAALYVSGRRRAATHSSPFGS